MYKTDKQCQFLCVQRKKRNLRFHLRNSHNSVRKLSFFMLFMSCMVNIHSADIHYTKIISLNNQLSANSANLSTTDTLKLYMQILDTTAQIDTSTKYSLEEINTLLDIVLSITKENSSILRNEEIIYKLTLLLKDKNLKPDAKEFDKIVDICQANISYRTGSKMKRYIDTYLKTANLMKDMNAMDCYYEILKVVGNTTIRKCNEDEKEYVVSIFKDIMNDNLENKDEGLIKSFFSIPLYTRHRGDYKDYKELTYKFYDFMFERAKSKSKEFLMKYLLTYASIGLRDKPKADECIKALTKYPKYNKPDYTNEISRIYNKAFNKKRR